MCCTEFPSHFCMSDLATPTSHLCFGHKTSSTVLGCGENKMQEFSKHFDILFAVRLCWRVVSLQKGEIRGTYNNEQYKIYKIVEGVSVHDVVHDVYPSFQSDDLERKDKRVT